MESKVIQLQDIKSQWWSIYPLLSDYWRRLGCKNTHALSAWVLHRCEYLAKYGSDEGASILLVGDIAIPLSTLMTEDLGRITTLFGDCLIPDLNQKQVELLQTSIYAPLFNFQNTLGEYIVAATHDDFNQHVKELSQVGRALKKNVDVVLEPYSGNLDLGIVESNTQYFLDRSDNAQILSPEMIEDTEKLLRSCPTNECYRVKDATNTLGYAFIEVYPETQEIYWVYTVLSRTPETAKSSLGNYVVLRLLEMVYEKWGKGGKLNLGLDVFSYKTIWKPEHCFRKAAYLKDS